jgi:Uma2 family endonuclease
MLSAMDEPSLAASIRRISRREYGAMVEAGIFGPDDKVELLDGVLVNVSPQGWQHAAVLSWLTNELVRALDRTYMVRPQVPFAADDWSEPEPDVAVVRHDPNRKEHPSEVLLLIEVADSSVRYDRNAKYSIYARAGVPEYWIVNVDVMTVEVYTQPSPTGFASKQTLRDGDVLRPILLPGVEIAVADLPR